MLNKIQIVKNPNGDTRTAPKNVSFEDFAKANDMHINDVKKDNEIEKLKKKLAER